MCGAHWGHAVQIGVSVSLRNSCNEPAWALWGADDVRLMLGPPSRKQRGERQVAMLAVDV